MILTRASSYALHAVTYLASQKNNPLVPARTVAEHQGIAERFILRSLGQLVRARVVYGQKGPRGGYRLARPANKISVLDVIEAIEGSMHGQVAFMEAVNGGEKLNRRLEEVCERASEHVRRHLGHILIADLARTVGRKH
jgi:Rrf2 family protein